MKKSTHPASASRAANSTKYRRRYRRFSLLACTFLLLLIPGIVGAQSFGTSNLDFNGLGDVSSGTSLAFGPDGRLYVIQIDGTIDIFSIQRNGLNNYTVTANTELTVVKDTPNHNDDGTADSGTSREATGIAVAGTVTNPIIYATSSDARIGGPSGDKNLDTNSGVITRIAWVGTDINDPTGYWEAVDIVRGLPRSEENHATNGLDPVTINGSDYLILAQGGHANAGSPSTNFAWTTEYALSASVLAINLDQLEAMSILNDGTRDYIYDLPTVDDPTRANTNGIDDPNAVGYDGVDQYDPFGGNDGLNQAKIVAGGPVQIFSPGYRNAYDLVVTAGGAVYVTDNGANGGWGGFPENEGPGGTVTNNYRPGEPGSTGADPVDGEAQVNNNDHLTLVTNDIQNYTFGSFYGGHPAPIRANPAGAGLFARGPHSSDIGDSNGNTYEDDWFRTVNYDPNGSGDATDPQRALPADWPPVPVGLADPVQGDFRNPGGTNPDGPVDNLVTTWSNNTNGIDEYTASNFGGAMQGDLIAGKSGGSLHRVQVNPDGSLDTLTQNFFSNLGGNPLGITANGDADPFPGTIWVATFNLNIVVLEPQDFVICILPGQAGYDPLGDNDSDGYTNQDEDDNGSDMCNGGSQPGDFDKLAGGALVSDLNDPDDDNDGINDQVDTLQIGNPVVPGTDAFALPVSNELFSDNLTLGGYLGLGFTGMMNNGAANPNWLNWLDQTDAGPNPNDILGGAVGAMTMQMGPGTAVGATNDQTKAFQYGVDVGVSTGGLRIEGRMLNFDAGLQLYPFAGDGELGIFIGDGTQSNFIQFTVDDTGVEVLQEIADTPTVMLSAPIAVIDRPIGSLAFRLDVDSVSGYVEALYSIDGGAFASLGGFTTQGTILSAIQQPNEILAVGLIGTSNTPGAEVEGTWDYLNVTGRQPAIEAPFPNVEEPVGGATGQAIDLDQYFTDDDGDANITYTIESQTDTSIGASIAGNVLTLTYPNFVASSTIVIRATDGNGLYVEQSIVVTIVNPVPIYRINAGGAEIAAIDGGIPWEQDTTANNHPHLTNNGGNNQAGFSMVSYAPEVDLVTTPSAIYNTERWASTNGAPSMAYGFPVSAGSYEVRLYMGNGWSGASSPGQRIFSATIEGNAFGDLTDLDLSDTFGHQVGGLVTHIVNVSDGTLDIEFTHGAANNPMLNGIEIISGSGSPPGGTPITVDNISDQHSAEGAIINLSVIAGGGDTPASFAFGATGLPDNLQIEPTTGLIFGTVAVDAHLNSPYAVAVTVDDNDADATDIVTENFFWTIPDPNLVVWIDKAEDESYTARHECSFVQAGDKFYMFGGRENAQTLDTYDYTSNSWMTSASAPLPFNHFQATEHEGLIWVVGAFETNSFPNEDPADHVWVFDPANNAWTQGPQIPPARQRGGSGLVLYNDSFYMVGGNTLGHNGGYVAWFDEFDPETGQFTTLPAAPRARDHFHAAVVGDELFVIGGRLSGGPGGTFAPLIPEVDVYNFTSGSWSTLPAGSNLPTPRAASAMAVFDGKIMVIGGEGNGQAYDTVEALNPATSNWETLSTLNYARHGTQAIVSGNGVYVAAGSPNQGGGNQKNMEVYNLDQPAGVASVAGALATPASVEMAAGLPNTIQIDHASGNEGVYVETVVLSGVDAADFAFVTPVNAPFLLPASNARSIDIEYIGPDGNATATVDITVNGGMTYSITVNAVPAATLDRDADGMPDAWEMMNGTNYLVDDSALDPDGDGIANIDEFRAGTDPQQSSSFPEGANGVNYVLFRDHFDNDQLDDRWYIGASDPDTNFTLFESGTELQKTVLRPQAVCKSLRLDSFATVDATDVVLHAKLSLDGYGATAIGLMKNEDPNNRIEVTFDGDQSPYLAIRSWDAGVLTEVIAESTNSYQGSSADVRLMKIGTVFTLYVGNLYMVTNSGLGNVNLRPYIWSESCLADTGYVDVRIDLLELLLDRDGDGLADLHEDANVNGAVDLNESDPLGPDFDSDLVLDGHDNCLLASNPNQRDTDGDGYGNLCDGDLDNNLAVNFSDLVSFKSVFNTADPNADFNGDGAVNFSDLVIFKALFNKAPGPSGTAP